MEWFKTIPFSDVVLWDVKRYSFEKIQSQYPIVKLGMHIQEESHKVKLADYPDEEFGILGVNNKIGIFDAYKEKGANINQSYKQMEKGWLAYNPYRVNVGSIGLRTEEHENEYISPAYVVFSCKETLLPDFLFKLFKTERFNKVINASTTGSVRQNLTIDILKSLDIPLPPIQIQQKILDEYYLLINKSKKIIEQVSSFENKKENTINNLLGLKQIEKEKRKGLYFENFSLIDRWDLWSVNQTIKSSIYQMKPLKSIITLQSGSFLPKSEMIEGDFLVYGGNGVSGSHNTFKLQGERIIIGRVGEYCGNVHLINGKYWVTDNALWSEIIDENIDIDYLRIALQALKLNKHRILSAQPSISQTTILSLMIPYPRIEVQKEISNAILSMENEIKEFNTQAEKLIETALKTLEKNVFKL